MTTVEGERPGAKAGLLESGIREPTDSVNLCILRGDSWVWRKGGVDLRWIPDMEAFRYKFFSKNENNLPILLFV